MRAVVEEAGPGHHCQAAIDRTRRSWNPLIADRMMEAGAMHYLETLRDDQVDVVRCLACGKMWTEER